MIAPPPPEVAWIVAATLAIALATLCAVGSAVVEANGRAGGPPSSRRIDATMDALLLLGLVLVAAGIALRWQRIGHGPFLSLFEVLASSLFSLGLAYALALWRLPSIRRTAVIVLPVLLLIALWLVASPPSDTHLPPTYETPVLWFHVLLGKGFLGCALVALGLAGTVLVRPVSQPARWFARMPADAALDRLAWRFMSAALLLESLMLIAGAVWAQDAWGRYWAWDPLETWAFCTWLVLVGAVHARTTWRVAPRTGAWLIVAVFALAFLTFFGVPFVSVAPHKGAV